MTIRRILKTLITQTNLMNNNKRMPKLSIMCGVKRMSCDLVVLLTCRQNDPVFFFFFFNYVALFKLKNYNNYCPR